MKTLMLLTVLILGCATPAMADGYLGVLFGGSYVGKSGGNQLLYGARLGGKIAPSWSLGFYGSYEKIGSGAGVFLNNLLASGEPPTSATEVILTPEADFHPFDDERLRLGFRLGTGITTVKGTFSEVSNTDFAFGPVLGSEFALGPHFALGAEASALLVITAMGPLPLVNIAATLTYLF